MSAQETLKAMEIEMATLLKKYEMVPVGSMESTLLSASIATLQQQIDEHKTP